MSIRLRVQLVGPWIIIHCVNNIFCISGPSSAGTTKHIHAKFTTVKKGYDSTSP